MVTKDIFAWDATQNVTELKQYLLFIDQRETVIEAIGEMEWAAVNTMNHANEEVEGRK